MTTHAVPELTEDMVEGLYEGLADDMGDRLDEASNAPGGLDIHIAVWPDLPPSVQQQFRDALASVWALVKVEG